MKKFILMATTVIISTLAFSQDEKKNEKEEQAVRSLVSTIQTGWNNKSGETFASVFADVHDYIVVSGLYFPNWTQKANPGAHQGLFDTRFKNTDLSLNIDKINFLKDDLVMINALGASYETGGKIPENPEVIMTILAEKKDGVWKIISFHNHLLDEQIEKASPMPLKVMYASWYEKK